MYVFVFVFFFGAFVRIPDSGSEQCRLLVVQSQAAAAASQSVCSRPQTRARVAANSVTPPSDSTAPPSDSGTVGNTDVLEVEEDVPVGSKRKLRSEVWEEIDLIKVNVDLESRMPLV
jgi:hypothetical protein